MKFVETPLKGSYEIFLQPIADNRGWFSRTFCKKEFQQMGHTEEWVQNNHSFTSMKGAIRGMHFQYPPHCEIKMVRCISGIIFDVIVDIRKGSPTFLQWYGVELSAVNKKMLYIPKGFAHGFQTLTNDCEIFYYHSNFYEKNYEGALHFNDPTLNIKWKLEPTDVSTRDSNHSFIQISSFEGLNVFQK